MRCIAIRGHRHLRGLPGAPLVQLQLLLDLLHHGVLHLIAGQRELRRGSGPCATQMRQCNAKQWDEFVEMLKHSSKAMKANLENKM